MVGNIFVHGMLKETFCSLTENVWLEHRFVKCSVLFRLSLFCPIMRVNFDTYMPALCFNTVLSLSQLEYM